MGMRKGWMKLGSWSQHSTGQDISVELTSFLIAQVWCLPATREEISGAGSHMAACPTQDLPLAAALNFSTPRQDRAALPLLGQPPFAKANAFPSNFPLT